MLDASLANWAEQRKQRLALGDDLDQPRSIVHVFHFRDAKQALAAMSELDELRLPVTQNRSRFRTAVTAERVDMLGEENVSALLGLAIPLADQFGGTYDGFSGVISGADRSGDLIEGLIEAIAHGDVAEGLPGFRIGRLDSSVI